MLKKFKKTTKSKDLALRKKKKKEKALTVFNQLEFVLVSNTG